MRLLLIACARLPAERAEYLPPLTSSELAHAGSSMQVGAYLLAGAAAVTGGGAASLCRENFCSLAARALAPASTQKNALR